MAPDNEVNKFHIDGTTSLTALYSQTIEQKKKYSDITDKKTKYDRPIKNLPTDPNSKSEIIVFNC
jgi:hypothetical protein